MDLFKLGRNLVAESRVQSCQRTFFLAWKCRVQRRHWGWRKRFRQVFRKSLRRILRVWRIEGLVRLCRRRHLAWRLQAAAAALAAAGPAPAPAALVSAVEIATHVLPSDGCVVIAPAHT